MKPARFRYNKNQARLTRTFLWAGLWLAWVGEHLAGALTRFRVTRQLTAPLRESLAYMTRVIAAVLLLTAAQRVTAAPRRHRRIYGPRLQPAALTRAMIGAAVRKRLRAGSPAEQIALLAAILRDPERIVEMLVERLETGLTRLDRHLAAHDDARACDRFVPVLHLADTS